MDTDLQAIVATAPTDQRLLLDVLRLQVCRDEQRRLTAVGDAAWSPYELAKEDAVGLYRLCFDKACDLRRQAMSTSTTKATEDDILADISRIATSLYDLAVAGTKSVVESIGVPPSQ